MYEIKDCKAKSLGCTYIRAVKGEMVRERRRRGGWIEGGAAGGRSGGSELLEVSRKDYSHV
jgi:hypothetical protein